MSKVVYTGMTFYIVLIVLLGVAGIDKAQDKSLEFPEYPNVESIDSIPVLNEIFAVGEFLAFILIILAFIGELIAFRLPELLPSWLNIILFMPLVAFIIWEISVNMIRGS